MMACVSWSQSFLKMKFTWNNVGGRECELLSFIEEVLDVLVQH